MYTAAWRFHQNVFRITVQNANASDKDKFYEIVMNTLKDVVKTGLNKKSIEGSINRTEFQLEKVMMPKKV